jgi:hypothetical protein
LVALPKVGHAQRRRPIFEPTDLEMETPGTAEIDVQFGAYQSDVARLVVPDVEIDLGLFPHVEIDVDGAYTLEGPDDGRFTFTHPAPDNIWVAAKLGLWDSREQGETSAWALGAQLGPKFPVAHDLHGLGYEGLLLMGRVWDDSHFVANIGALVDPGAEISRHRTVGIEGGLDGEFDLGRWHLSVTGELGGVRYFSSDPNDLHATAGFNWGVNDDLDISLVGLVGFLPGGDHEGVLLGISPKLKLWQ